MKIIFYPKPKKLSHEILPLEEVSKHRKFDCIFYNLCLDHAAHFKYISFTCIDCLWYYKDNNEYDNSELENCKLLNKMIEKRIMKYNLKKE